MIFGSRLKNERIRKGLTQEDLGKIINKSKNNISQYETGKREPDIQTLNKFSEIFGCTLDYLLGQDNPNIKPRKKYHGDELLDILPDKYRELFKEQNIGYVKFAKEMMKEQINPETLIKLLEHHLQLKEDLKKDKEINNT